MVFHVQKKMSSGGHYHVESVHEKRQWLYCGIIVEFKKSTWSRAKDRNINWRQYTIIWENTRNYWVGLPLF